MAQGDEDTCRCVEHGCLYLSLLPHSQGSPARGLRYSIQGVQPLWYWKKQELQVARASSHSAPSPSLTLTTREYLAAIPPGAGLRQEDGQVVYHSIRNSPLPPPSPHLVSQTIL